MEKRHAVRYAAAELPTELSIAILMLPDNTAIKATVENLSTLGINVKVDVEDVGQTLVQRNDTVTVMMAAEQIKLSALCVNSYRPNPSLLEISLYFFNPHEQNCFYDRLCSMDFSRHEELGCDEDVMGRNTHKPFVSHQWDELLDTLLHSENPELRILGMREKESRMLRNRL